MSILLAEAVEHIKKLLSDLDEAHIFDILNKHYGDKPGTCLYCQTMGKAKSFLRHVFEKQPKPRVVITVAGGVSELAATTPGIEIICIDYDVEGSDDGELCHCHIAGANAAHVHRKMHEEFYFVKPTPAKK